MSYKLYIFIEDKTAGEIEFSGEGADYIRDLIISMAERQSADTKESIIEAGDGLFFFDVIRDLPEELKELTEWLEEEQDRMNPADEFNKFHKFTFEKFMDDYNAAMVRVYRYSLINEYSWDDLSDKCFGQLIIN